MIACSVKNSVVTDFVVTTWELRWKKRELWIDKLKYKYQNRKKKYTIGATNYCMQTWIQLKCFLPLQNRVSQWSSRISKRHDNTWQRLSSVKERGAFVPLYESVYDDRYTENDCWTCCTCLLVSVSVYYLATFLMNNLSNSSCSLKTLQECSYCWISTPEESDLWGPYRQ